MISGKSQSTVAACLSCGELSLNYVFIAKFGSEKNFKIGACMVKLQAKRLIDLCALFILQLSCIKMKNWPDNLPVMNRNCFCFCFVTTQIIFTSMSTVMKLTSIFLQLF